MNETAPVQKQDIDRIVRLLELILAELKRIQLPVVVTDARSYGIMR